MAGTPTTYDRGKQPTNPLRRRSRKSYHEKSYHAPSCATSVAKFRMQVQNDRRPVRTRNLSYVLFLALSNTPLPRGRTYGSTYERIGKRGGRRDRSPSGEGAQARMTGRQRTDHRSNVPIPSHFWFRNFVSPIAPERRERAKQRNAPVFSRSVRTSRRRFFCLFKGGGNPDSFVPMYRFVRTVIPIFSHSRPDSFVLPFWSVWGSW